MFYVNNNLIQFGAVFSNEQSSELIIRHHIHY